MNSTAITTRNETGLAIFEAGHSILGETSVRIPVSGKIRPGIKVLTAAGRALKGAESLYNEMLLAGCTWDTIEREIKKRHPDFNKSPLTPRNAPYFSVFSRDFGMPEVANLIMSTYGEDRGEGRHLYRFPVMFGFDQLQQVLPHQFAMHQRSERKYWSDYDPDGMRHCMTHEAVVVDPKAQRAHKTWGGRKIVPRQDNGGICNPEACREFQSGACKLSGQLIVYIPGIPGVGAIAVPTTSIYSLKRIRDKLAVVHSLRGGRISGSVNGKPLFWVTKREEEVSMLDPETGLPKKVRQWLVVLEEDVDMTKLMIAQEAPMLLEQGAAAAAALEAPKADNPPPVEAAPTKAPEPTPAELRAAIETALGVAQIHKATFRRYAESKYPGAWREDIRHLASLLDVAVAAKEDERVMAQVQTFAEPDGL